MREIDLALRASSDFVQDEARFEAISILSAYGDPDSAGALLGTVGPVASMPTDLRDQHPAALAELEIRRGRYAGARQILETIVTATPHRDTAFKVRVMTLRAFAAKLAGDPDAQSLAREANNQAHRQGAGRAEFSPAFCWPSAKARRAWMPFFGARGLCGPVGDHDGRAVPESRIRSPRAHSDPGQRRRPSLDRNAGALPLRTALEHGPRASVLMAASLLELVGEASDVRLLRRFAKESKGAASMGRILAKRVADRAQVLDLGRVSVLVGGRQVSGDSIRRKVLALLCFLITRPGMSAARDQVVDALWPDQDPDAASNSLNQTVYFLRRVFEPQYAEDLSPGYVHHEVGLALA